MTLVATISASPVLAAQLPEAAWQQYGGGPLTERDYSQYLTACRQYDRAGFRQAGLYRMLAGASQFQLMSPIEGMYRDGEFRASQAAATQRFKEDAGPVQHVIRSDDHMRTLMTSDRVANESKWEMAVYFIMRVFADPTSTLNLRTVARQSILAEMKESGAVSESDEAHLLAIIAIMDCDYSSGESHYHGSEPFQTALAMARVYGEKTLRTLDKFRLTTDERKAVILAATAEDPFAGMAHVSSGQIAELGVEFAASVAHEAVQSFVALYQHRLVNDEDASLFMNAFISLATKLPVPDRAALLTELFNNLPEATAMALLHNYGHDSLVDMWTMPYNHQGFPRVFAKITLAPGKAEAQVSSALTDSVQKMLGVAPAQFGDPLTRAIDSAITALFRR